MAQNKTRLHGLYSVQRILYRYKYSIYACNLSSGHTVVKAPPEFASLRLCINVIQNHANGASKTMSERSMCGLQNCTSINKSQHRVKDTFKFVVCHQIKIETLLDSIYPIVTSNVCVTDP